MRRGKHWEETCDSFAKLLDKHLIKYINATMDTFFTDEIIDIGKWHVIIYKFNGFMEITYQHNHSDSSWILYNVDSRFTDIRCEMCEEWLPKGLQMLIRLYVTDI
jgi:hypothetical protein